MAPVDEGDRPLVQRPSLGPSAAIELMWLGHQLVSPRPEAPIPFVLVDLVRAQSAADRLRDFWGDGVSGGVGELLVIADQAGFLLSPDLDQFLGELPAPEPDPSQIRLRSESPEDRQRFIERLGRLGRETRLRRRYGALLSELWEQIRPEWEERGLPAVLAVCQRVGQRLDLGMALEDAVPVLAELSGKEAKWRSMVDGALAAGSLVLVPTYFAAGNWSFWDLPRHVVVGFNETWDPLADARSAGRRLAPGLRALGDPTRLSILLYLAAQPTSVGEVARRFELAQPTISAHLRALRSAGLVEGTRLEGRTVYRADRGRLERLLQELADSSGLNRAD